MRDHATEIHMQLRYKRGPWKSIAAAGVVCALVLASRAHAQSSAAPAGEAAAVRAAASEYLAAMQRGDAAKLRTLWTADGDYVDAAGQVLKAQDVIAAVRPVEMTTAEGGAATAPTSTLRFPAPNVAIEDGRSGSQSGDDAGGLAGRFTAIWVKQDGKWLLSALRETAEIAPPGSPQLQALAWLVGEWTGAADDAVILISWQWSDGGNYLVGEYVIYREGQAVAGGSQRVGWDPVAKQFKSWIFDSQGVTGEGRWRADGKRWLVDATHVTADGKRAKSTATYTPGDETMIWEVAGDWQAGDAAAGDAKLPTRRVEFRRAMADE